MRGLSVISKVTENFARQRSMDAVLVDGMTLGPMQREYPLPAFWLFCQNDMEPDAIYWVNQDGSFTYHSSVLLSSIRAELPAHVRDEKHLRRVIDFIATAVRASSAIETVINDDTAC